MAIPKNAEKKLDNVVTIKRRKRNMPDMAITQDRYVPPKCAQLQMERIRSAAGRTEVTK